MGKKVIRKQIKCLLNTQAKANAVIRSESPTASKQILQRLAVGDHM